MSRKRRMFDIEMPEDAEGPRVSSLDSPRPKRGPMASAIAENADAIDAREKAAAAIREENDALAHEYVALREAGQVVSMIPLDDIVTEALIRDRSHTADMELSELVSSIRDVGLSNPIRVEARDDGKYELIQGFRRLAAYKQLREEEGEAWDTIPAANLPRGEGIPKLYRRMVDENLVRKDLSFAEMANAARAYALDPATRPTDIDGAVREVFASASYTKRSYIRAFARLLDLIEKHVTFPEEIPRNLGLALLKRIEEGVLSVQEIADHLGQLGNNRSIVEEVEALRELNSEVEGLARKKAKPAKGQGGRRARTTFEVGHGRSRAKCVANEGQLTIKLDRDFTAIDRRTLERSLAQFLASLG